MNEELAFEPMRDANDLPPYPQRERPPIVDYDPFGSPFEDEKIFDDGF